MNKEELILEIRKQIANFNEVNSQDSPYQLERIGREILKLLRELIELLEGDKNSEKDQIIRYKIIHADLSHTIGKEVQYAIGAYAKTKQRNAPKIRQREYENEVNGAISRMNSDLFWFKTLQ